MWITIVVLPNFYTRLRSVCSFGTLFNSKSVCFRLFSWQTCTIIMNEWMYRLLKYELIQHKMNLPFLVIYERHSSNNFFLFWFYTITFWIVNCHRCWTNTNTIDSIFNMTIVLDLILSIFHNIISSTIPYFLYCNIQLHFALTCVGVPFTYL